MLSQSCIYKNVIGVLFTGSRVIGDVNATSDYDFRVLLKDGVNRYRKGFYINNLFADTYCNCYMQEMSYLADEITQGNFNCLDLAINKLKLEGLDLSKDCLFYILDLQHKLFDYFFKLHNIWKVRSRDTDKKLQLVDSEFYNYFKQALMQDSVANKIVSLIKSVEHLQEKFKLDQSIEFSVL